MKRKFLLLGSLLTMMSVSACSGNVRESNGYGYIPGIDYHNNWADGDQEMLMLNESYQDLKENPFMLTESTAESYFSMDSNTASYSNLRRYIEYNQAINPDLIKTDELINYFNYNLPFPEEADFRATAEIGKAPWSNNKLLTLGITSKIVDQEDFEGNNYVFLIDVSGSMRSSNRIDLVKESICLLADKLTNEDNVSIVTYASGVKVVANGLSGAFKEEIKEKVNSLQAGGATNGQGGIEKAYEIAKENYIKGGNNRIIIASDGDFNVGVSSTESIADLVKSKLNEGIYVTCLGFGMGNYKDSTMETIAKNGNGGYYYIDSQQEAKKVFETDLNKTLYVVSKDTKTKVSFNKDIVKAYRLIGYENKALTQEQFEDEKADAGEIGSGHTSMVCYEVVLEENASLTDNAFTLDINYKEPKNSESRTFNNAFALETITNGTTDNFRFVASIIEFSLILRDSPYKGDANYTDLLRRMDAIPSVHVDKEKGEFFGMVYAAKEKGLVASKAYDQVVIIRIEFRNSYSFYYHEAGAILKVEDILEELGYGKYSRYNVKFFYDMTFTEEYVNKEVDASITLFAKVSGKTAN